MSFFFWLMMAVPIQMLLLLAVGPLGSIRVAVASIAVMVVWSSSIPILSSSSLLLLLWWLPELLQFYWDCSNTNLLWCFTLSFCTFLVQLAVNYNWFLYCFTAATLFGAGGVVVVVISTTVTSTDKLLILIIIPHNNHNHHQ